MYKSKSLINYREAHKILDPSLTKSSVEKSTGQTKSGLHEAIKKLYLTSLILIENLYCAVQHYSEHKKLVIICLKDI